MNNRPERLTEPPVQANEKGICIQATIFFMRLL